MSRACKFVKDDGGQCRAAPLRNSDFCFWHDPASAQEVMEARRLGGLRRRREKTTAIVYEWDGLNSAEEIQRMLVIAANDTLALENSVARNRTLAYLGSVAVKILEAGALEERVAALERLLGERK